jgi:hypothetical protein
LLLVTVQRNPDPLVLQVLEVSAVPAAWNLLMEERVVQEPGRDQVVIGAQQLGPVCAGRERKVQELEDPRVVKTSGA